MSVFFLNDTATTEIYTLSLHDALPISPGPARARRSPSWPPRRAWRCPPPPPPCGRAPRPGAGRAPRRGAPTRRSEEHTSELQSRQYLVCRLLLEKKNTGHVDSLVSRWN